MRFGSGNATNRDILYREGLTVRQHLTVQAMRQWPPPTHAELAGEFGVCRVAITGRLIRAREILGDPTIGARRKRK